MPSSIKAVLFDAFGTLVHITDSRRPYAQLLKMGKHGPSAEDKARIMSHRVSLRDVAALYDINVSEAQMLALEADLEVEKASIAKYAEVDALITEIKARGLKVGICSNLAEPYGVPVRNLVPDCDAYAWSYDCDVKPSPYMYAYACRLLGCERHEILMVGDTPAADVIGPRAYGMHALLLQRPEQRLDELVLPFLDVAARSKT